MTVNQRTNSKSPTHHDHVARIVSQHFDVRNNELVIGGVPVSDLVRQYGSPLFVYDRDVIERRIRAVQQVLPDPFELFYSVKANPNATILKCFLDHGCGLEVASGGELFQALQAGCPPQRLIFAGPGKTKPELAAAVSASVLEIHVESLEEVRVINDLAQAHGTTATIAFRVNPVDAAGGAMQMGGKPSPFGIDEENLDPCVDAAIELPNLSIAGVHLYMGTQILDANILLEQYETALDIAIRVAQRISKPLSTVDFGGGLGTPYFPHESELEFDQLSRVFVKISQRMKQDPWLSQARGILEPGRFLVNEAGIYIAQVTRIKHSRGKTFAVIDGGMHHHLAASGNLGQTIKRNYPVAVLNRIHEPATQSVEVVGPLCTPLDTLARNARLPKVEAGDLFGVFQSGAYARTSSPLAFLGHDSPAEVMVANGKASLIRRRGNPADHLRDQSLGSPSDSDALRRSDSNV